MAANPWPVARLGGVFERERAQNVGQALEPRLVGVEPLGVAGGELGDLGFRAPRPDLEIAPVGQGQEIRQRALDDAEPVGVKLEIADDRRVQKRDRVGGDRIAKAGVKFLGDRRAADLRPALEHRDLEAGHGEIGGGDKAVVAAADDDDVRHQAPRCALPATSEPSPGRRAHRDATPEGEGSSLLPREKVADEPDEGRPR